MSIYDELPVVLQSDDGDVLGEQFLTQRELAKRWNCSERTLEGMRQRGQGPVHVKVGGLVRYARTDVETYERVQRRIATPGRRRRPSQ